MTDEQVLAKLTPIFRDVFNDQAIMLRMDTMAEDIRDWNSISHVTLVVEIESEFGLHFRSSEMERLRDVRTLVDVIQAKMPITAG